MIVVLDTSVLISGLLFPTSALAEKLDKISRKHTIVRSAETTRELVAVLKRPKLRRYFTEKEAKEYLENYIEDTVLIKVYTRITACRDASDNKFLALAVDGKAEAIITSDQDLLALNPFKAIRIMQLKDV